MGRDKKKDSSHKRSSKSRSKSRNAEVNDLKRKIRALESMIQNSVTSNSEVRSLTPPTQPLTTPLNSPRNLPNISESSSQRYVGRFELVPEFDASTDTMTIHQWLNKIDSVGELYSWDDRAKVFCMIAKLAGNAKSWYECQSDINCSWADWKERLMRAFPDNRCIAEKLKEFVNKERKSDEDVVSFYYSKLRLGKHCDLSDAVIVDVVIATLNNNLLRASARAAGCKNTEQLLQFLVQSDYKSFNTGYFTQKQTLDDNRRTLDRARNKVKRCFKCAKAGHVAVECQNKYNTNLNLKKCTICKRSGHVKENCFRFNSNAAHSSKINIVTRNDAKYHVLAKVNNKEVQAYVDFGSACNIMKLCQAVSLGLPIDTNKKIIMKGFGGGTVTSIGEVDAKIKVDDVERQVPIAIVDNEVQETDLLIGQPFTELSDVYTIKTGNTLQFTNQTEI